MVSPHRDTRQSIDSVFVNNFTVLHARTIFKHVRDAQKKRLLLRLWMMGPVVPEIQIYDSGREGGVPPQPGRKPS